MDLVRAVVCAILVYFQIGGTLLYRCNTCHGNTATLLMVTVGSPASQGGDALQVILSASIASHMAVNIESYIRWQWWWLLSLSPSSRYLPTNDLNGYIGSSTLYKLVKMLGWCMYIVFVLFFIFWHSRAAFFFFFSTHYYILNIIFYCILDTL